MCTVEAKTPAQEFEQRQIRVGLDLLRRAIEAKSDA